MFHYACVIQWLEKAREECAYCRKDMLNDVEFRHAAEEALGRSRVDDLVKNNEEDKESRKTIGQSPPMNGAEDVAGQTEASPSSTGAPSMEAGDVYVELSSEAIEVCREV